MKISDRVYISSSCIKGATSYSEAIDFIISTGIKNIEISGNHKYLNNLELEALLKKYINNEVNFIFHNYFPTPQKEIVMNILSRKKEYFDNSIQIIKNAINLAKETNTHLYGIHPGYLRDAIVKKGKFNFFGEKSSIDNAIEFYKTKFKKIYENLEINQKKTLFGLENLFPNFDKSNDSFMCSFEEIDEILNIPFIKKSNLGIILDLGHLNISSNILNFDKKNFLNKIIDLHSDKIYEVHISENQGEFDTHDEVMPNSWQLNVLKEFRNTGTSAFPTRFTLESRNLSSDKIKKNYELILEALK